MAKKIPNFGGKNPHFRAKIDMAKGVVYGKKKSSFFGKKMLILRFKKTPLFMVKKNTFKGKENPILRQKKCSF